jgi:hypothetical protein
MEIVKRKRGRPRIFPGVESAAKKAAAFPSAEEKKVINEPSPVGAIFDKDAQEKKEVKESVAKIPEIFTPEQVIWCFDVYVAIICFVYSLLLKTDFKALQDELAFSEEQKTAMAKPLARIVSKYAPASWAGMSAEIELITMMGIWTVSSFPRARNVAAAEVEKKKDAERTQPVPIPQQRNRQEVHVPA